MPRNKFLEIQYMDTFICRNCGVEHTELSSLAFNAPFHYDILNPVDKEKLADKDDDFCVINHKDQIDYFIRVVLQVPILDHDETLDYGVWVSVSKETIDDYRLMFATKEVEEKSYFGMLCNEITDYEISTIGLYMQVSTQLDGYRPLLIPYESEHPLVQDWLNGIRRDEAVRRVKSVL